MSGLRLVPPPLELTPELGWILVRAFAPTGHEAPKAVDGKAVWTLALELDLDCRIGCRVPLAQLRREVGEVAARLFSESYREAAVFTVVANTVARNVAKIASGIGVDVVFLKSNALLLSGISAVGSRRLSDIDLLVGAEASERLEGALQSAGFSHGGRRVGSHHLAPLSHSSGLTVEVHTLVKHVRLNRGSSWVSAQDLWDGGWLGPLEGLGGSWIPNPSFLAAHTIVHSVVQHWGQAIDYPLLRSVGDLIDLAAAGWPLRAPAEAAPLWLRQERAQGKGGALIALATTLTHADWAETASLAEELGSNLFLRHAVALQCDPDYRNAVKAGGVFWVDRNRSALVALARKLRNRLILDRKALEARYGPADNPLRLIAWRIWRPFDLARKAVGFVRTYLRYRFTRGSRGRGSL